MFGLDKFGSRARSTEGRWPISSSRTTQDALWERLKAKVRLEWSRGEFDKESAAHGHGKQHGNRDVREEELRAEGRNHVAGELGSRGAGNRGAALGRARGADPDLGGRA